MNKSYTDDEKTEFISVAQEIGVGPAMRELKYPGSHHTASRWFEEAGEQLPDVSYLQRKARALRDWYSDKEELAAVQLMLDRLVESLEKSDMDADSLNKIANALQRAIQTKRLIEGKATNVTEQHDAADAEMIRLVEQMKSQNDTEIAERGRL